MTPIRVAIADDEPPARAKVRRFLADDPAIAIVAEAGSGLETIAAVERTRPDLLFLDVQMPETDGFGVLAAIEPATLPLVIFTTAYDEYAIRAFDVHAIDYLLKPFDEERFRRALRRAVHQIRGAAEGEVTSSGISREDVPSGLVAGRVQERGAAAQMDGTAGPGAMRDRQTRANPWEEQLQRLLDEAQIRNRPLDRILVRRGDTATLISTAEITWIEAAGNYSRLHTADGSHLIRGTLSGLEARLDPNRFARIHRSHIVNLDQVRSLHPWSHGDWLVRLQDGTELMLSRRYRDRLPFDAL